MAVVNQYKFYGKYIEAAESGTLLAPLISETIIIKSLRVTNKSGANTPTLTLKDNGVSILWATTLDAATSVELLSLPLIVEGNTTLTYTTVGDCTDGVVIAISYLNIKKEVTV